MKIDILRFFLLEKIPDMRNYSPPQAGQSSRGEFFDAGKRWAGVIINR